MTRRRALTRGALVPLVAASSLTFLPLDAALAHNDFYAGHRWDNATNVNYYFRNSFPTDYRPRIRDGFAQWNDTPNDGLDEPDFIHAGEETGGDWNEPCNSAFNGIYYLELDSVSSSALGVVYRCVVSGGRVIRFSMSFDEQRPWYSGTGETPAGSYDLWSMASHEAGHATGWGGHLAEDGQYCPNDPSRHTMCPTLYPGTERQRHLEVHDYHTFEGAYPWDGG